VNTATLIEVALIGMAVGFLGGLFGKGGSAVATPLLAAIGVPPLIAVASPLPAVIPSSLVSARTYGKAGCIDRRLVLWCTLGGLPATLAGALATRWVSGTALVVMTEVLLLALGLRFLIHPSDETSGSTSSRAPWWRIAVVAVGVGFIAGLLANGGGFLFAPLFVVVLGRPLKQALGTSALLATVLAVPGTIVHAALGHIDWTITLVFALASVPFAQAGARVAVRMRVRPLERVYGVALAAMSVAFLALAV
jgi:uncharacterized membrane protein YfcA